MKLESVYQSSQEKAREHEAKMEAERGRTAQVSSCVLRVYAIFRMR